MASPQVSPSECLERHALFMEFKTANQRLVEIHETEIKAVLADDLTTFEKLQPDLRRTRNWRDMAAETLQRHMREHGC